MIYIQLPDKTRFENECLKQQNEQLRDIVSQIDLQGIGEEMGLKIGQSISGKILGYIRKLKEQKDDYA